MALPNLFVFRHAGHRLALAIIVVSILSGILNRMGLELFLFSPLATLYGFQIWRPFTSLLIANDVLEIIFGALIVYQLGEMLEQLWGRKRFYKIALGFPLLAMAFTLALALVTPDTFAGVTYSGARSILVTLWISYGLHKWFYREPCGFWGVALSGKTFALIGVGFVLLPAIFYSVTMVLPQLFCVGLCYGYMYNVKALRPVRSLLLAYDNWQLRKLKAKKGLKLVVKTRNDDDSGPIIH